MSGHKDEYPCNNYQLDMNASSFGACKCGWAKVDHGKGLGKPATTSPPPPPPPVAGPPPIKRPCDFFVADVTAQEFGMCTCGFRKAEHGLKGSDAEHLHVHLAPQGQSVADNVAKPKDDISSVFFAGSARNTVVNSNTTGTGATTGTGNGNGDGPCNNFTLDMSGGFGMCVCGYSREDHKKVMKDAEKQALIDKMIANGTAAKNAPALPPRGSDSHKGSGNKACGNYTVDVNAKTFGDCICGHPKIAHIKKESKFAQDKEEEEETDAATDMIDFEEPLIRDGVHVCSKFELDVANPKFDYCLCGFSRKEHQDRKTMSNAEYQKIKALLTKPKEFT